MRRYVSTLSDMAERQNVRFHDLFPIFYKEITLNVDGRTQQLLAWSTSPVELLFGVDTIDVVGSYALAMVLVLR